MENKKAEMTSKELIGIVILVLSFVIVLLFWRLYNPGGEIDKDACHTSIVLRSATNLGGIVGNKVTNAISLRCQTEKICLSMSGKDCEEFGKSTKNSPVTKIDVSSKQDIEREIANALYDCNSMVGEGKLDFMPTPTFSEKYCLICSRIAFDKEAKEQIQKISYEELYFDWMMNNKLPSGKSYFESIYSYDIQENSEKLEEARESADIQDATSQDWSLNLNNEHAILAATIPKGAWWTWTKAGAFAVVALASPLAGPFAPVVFLTAAGASGIIVVTEYPSGDSKYIPPVIVKYDLQTLQGMDCNSFETAP